MVSQQRSAYIAPISAGDVAPEPKPVAGLEDPFPGELTGVALLQGVSAGGDVLALEVLHRPPAPPTNRPDALHPRKKIGRLRGAEEHGIT